jgi:hypothetical protein
MLIPAHINLDHGIFKVGQGLYLICYRWLPGFNVLRVPARLMVFSTFCLAFLAGFGYKKLRKININRNLILVFVSGLILFEFNFIPFPFNRDMEKMKIYQNFPRSKKEMPAVYQWLAVQAGSEAVLELPINNNYFNLAYMYYSLFHGKSLVNGYNGFVPPDYRETVEIMNSFPDRASLDFIIKNRIKNLIIHGRGYSSDQLAEIKKNIKYFPEMKKVHEFDGDLVYQIKK